MTETFEPSFTPIIFSDLSNKELADISPLLRRHSFKANETIITHKEKTSSVYFIGSGSARSTTYTSNGKEICFQHLAAGDMFGELSAIDNLPRTTSVMAQTDCILTVINANDFWNLMEKYPSVMKYTLERLSSLVRFLCSRIYEFGAFGTRERTRAEILRIAKRHMIDNKTSNIEKMPTHEDIANRIASHREAVTKEFSFLAKIGLLQKQGKTLIVPDIHALSATLIEEIT